MPQKYMGKHTKKSKINKHEYFLNEWGVFFNERDFGNDFCLPLLFFVHRCLMLAKKSHKIEPENTDCQIERVCCQEIACGSFKLPEVPAGHLAV